VMVQEFLFGPKKKEINTMEDRVLDRLVIFDSKVRNRTPTHIDLGFIHITLRLGESDPESIALETGIPLQTTRRALLILVARRSVRWDDNVKEYVPAGIARSIKSRLPINLNR
jgi:hypothetical protein